MLVKTIIKWGLSLLKIVIALCLLAELSDLVIRYVP
jgi:hypothetical protein